MSQRILPSLSVAAALAIAAWVGGPDLRIAAQTPPSGGGPIPPSTTALVVGRVTDATTGAGIESAVVSVRTYAGLQIDQVRSNANGDFVLRDVPPGTSYVSATRNGYDMFPTASRMVVTTAADRLQVVSVRMAKYAVMGGLVTDETGEPMVGASVKLYTLGPTNTWDQTQSVVTDDRGRYRVWTLRAGSRLVAIQPSYASAVRGSPGSVEISGSVVVASGVTGNAIVSVDGRPQAFRAEFHRAGAIVTLAAGEINDAVDVQLVRVPAGEVSGRIEGAAEAVGRVPVQLVNADEPPGRPLRQPITTARTTTLADGRFTFAIVPAGRYVLKILQRPTPPPASTPAATSATAAGAVELATTTTQLLSGGRTLLEGPTFWANVPLVVTAEGVTNLVVPLQKGVRMTGRLEFDGASTRPTPAQMNLAFLTVWSDRSEFSPALIEKSGLFRTSGLASGRYVLRLTDVPAAAGTTWYPKSIVLNGRDVTDTFIDIADVDVADIVMTLTDRPASIAGTIRDQRGSAVPEAVVVAFPVDRSLRSAGSIAVWRVKQVAAGQMGEYAIRPLMPGDYFVAAATEGLTDRWTDPNVLLALESAATRVRLGEGVAARCDLFAITAFPARGGAALDDWTTGGPFSADADADAGEDVFVTQRDNAAGAGQAAYGSIEGTVASDTDGHEPVRSAFVVLTSTTGGPLVSTYTDDHGHFGFTQVLAGRYRVTASKPAHLTADYGATRPGRPGVPVQVGGASGSAIAITLPRGSVVTGRVMDERGQPVTDARVRVLTLHQAGSNLTLVSAPGATPVEATTDDRGEYRVYGLPRGEYYVGATPPPAATVGRETTGADLTWAHAQAKRSPATPGADRPSPAPPRGATIAQVPSFHPSGSTVATARPIRLAEAEELGGVDIRFRSEPAFTLAGTVIGAGGQPSSGARLTFIPEGLSVPTSLYGSSSTPGLSFSYGGVVNVTASAAGTFEIRSIVPGQYRLLARGSSPGTTSVTEWASAPIAIGTGDVRNVVVELQPAATVTVRIPAGGESSSRVTPSISLGLTPVTAGTGAITISGVRPDSDGRFTFRGVVPGEYWISIANLPAAWIARNATAGGRDVLDQPLVVAASDAPEVVLSLMDRPSQIVGTFTDASGRPATDYTVIVFSGDRRHWRAGSRQISAVRPATDGRFATTGLPPGEYWLAAVSDADPNEWFDAEFLARLAPGAIAISLGEGETRTQDIRIAGSGGK